MEYLGQLLAENLYFYITVLISIVAWIVGYIYEDFQLTFYGWLGSMCLAVLLSIPDWPFFNTAPVIWLENVGDFDPSTPKLAVPVTSSSSSSSISSASTAPSITKKSKG